MARETQSTGDRLTVSNPAQVADLTAFTFACWMYIDGNGLGSSLGRIITKNDAGVVTRKLFNINNVGSIKRLSATVGRATTNATATSVNNVFSLATWTHVALAYDESGGCRLYSGGTEVSYASAPTVGSGATVADSGGDLIFMNQPNGLATLDGRLAQVGIWNRVLSGVELGLLSGSKYSPRLVRSGLVGCWPLFGVASPEPDIVYGNNASVTGAAQASDPAGLVLAVPRTTRRGMTRGTLLGVH